MPALPVTAKLYARLPPWVNLSRTGEDHSAMNFRIALKADAASVNFAHQLRQLGDIADDPSRLIPREQLGRRASPRLILEIDIGELLPVLIAHHEACSLFFDGPRWREAAVYQRACAFLIHVKCLLIEL
jgi:hypothetical protein